MFKKTIIFITILFLPFVVLAQDTGLIPCTGLDCTFCSFFELFHNLFNFAITILAPVVATFGIAYGGYYILLGGVKQTNVSKGKEVLKNTVIGFVIVYASYVIASTLVWFLAEGLIDGSGVRFGFSRGTFQFTCSGLESPSEGVDLESVIKGGVLTLSEKPPEVKDIKTEGDYNVARTDEEGWATTSGLNPSLESALSEAVDTANEQGGGFSMVVTSGYRDITRQQELARENCQDPAATKCDVFPGKNVTCIPNMTLDPRGSNCRHTTGDAVDVFGMQGVNQCGKADACQTGVVKRIMQSKGFCVLKTESWHFELKDTLAKDPARQALFDCS